MNKIVKYFIFIVFSFLLVGCSVKNDNNITINRNGSLNYSVLIAFDRDLLSALSKINLLETESDVEKYVNDNIRDGYLDGFKKEKYTDSTYIGNKYSYDVSNIDQVSSDKRVVVKINDENNYDRIVDQKLFYKFKGFYIADFVYTLQNKDTYENVDFLNTFTVNLPTSVISTNADKVTNNGKTLTWNIQNGDVKEIKFMFSFNNYKAYLALLSLLFDVIIIAIILIIKHKRFV